MAFSRSAFLVKGPQMCMHIAFGVVSLLLVAVVLYFVDIERKQGAYGMSMCSSIVFWTLPKFMCDISRHFTDAYSIWMSLCNEHVLLLEGSHAFESVTKFLTEINAGDCINGVAISRLGTFITYDIFATAFTVIFVVPHHQGTPGVAFADGKLVSDTPLSMCRNTQITISYTKESDWAKAADGRYVKKPSAMDIMSSSRTLNLKFIEYCGNLFYNIDTDHLPSTRPRTLPEVAEAE